MTGKRIPPWLSAGLVAGGFLALAWWERRRPLRRDAEPKLRREVRNLAIAATGGVVVQYLELPMVTCLTDFVERRRWGLLKRFHLPWWAEVLAGVALIDYSMYLWHLANHRFPELWRVHLPHHADRDVDASTALRFHFAELVATLPLRAVQILVFGAGPLTFSTWQALFACSILFHHSKVELPVEVEQRLLWLIVTPRMHSIHHSVVQDEAESNLSSGLSLWDRLHGTLRLNVPQATLALGVPAYSRAEDVTLGRVLAMPFGEPRADWLPLPDVGVEPGQALG
jgi:sterol desaturase/sphingolipid hydroxylase (fatty acid hydroxylase superfamily)